MGLRGLLSHKVWRPYGTIHFVRHADQAIPQVVLELVLAAPQAGVCRVEDRKMVVLGTILPYGAPPALIPVDGSGSSNGTDKPHVPLSKSAVVRMAMGAKLCLR